MLVSSLTTCKSAETLLKYYRPGALGSLSLVCWGQAKIGTVHGFVQGVSPSPDWG